MQWVVRHLIWSLETAVSIEDRMPKLADIISVHQICRVAKVSRQSLSAIPCDNLFQTSSRFYSLSVHKACVSHRVSLSWQQKLFVCGGVSWGKRFCKDSKLFVLISICLDSGYRNTLARECFTTSTLKDLNQSLLKRSRESLLIS